MSENQITVQEFIDRILTTEKKVDDIYKILSTQQNETISPEVSKKYTVPEAAQYLRMAEPTFRVHLRNNEITGSRLGKRWLFAQEDLEKFLKRYLVPSIDDLKEQGRLS